MKEKIEFNSQNQEKAILEQLGQEAMAKIRKDFPLEICRNNPELIFSLFEHLLISSTMDGQGILDKDTPVSVLAGLDEETAKAIRRNYIDEERGFPVGMYPIREGEIMVVYEIILKLKNPEITINLENIENIDFENTAITILATEKPKEEKKEEEEGKEEETEETEPIKIGSHVLGAGKKKEIIRRVFLRVEERWQEKREEELEKFQETAQEAL